MKLSDKVIFFRKKKNLTQEELAELSNVTLRTIQRVERGETVPRGFTLKSIAKALDQDVSEFTAGEHEAVLTEDQVKSFLQYLNFLSLTYLFVPYGNLFIPWLVWRKNNNDKKIFVVGRKIIAYQFVWMMGTCLAILAGVAVQILMKQFFGLKPWIGILPIFFFMYLINVPIILVASSKLRKGDFNVYPVTSFFIS